MDPRLLFLTVVILKNIGWSNFKSSLLIIFFESLKSTLLIVIFLQVIDFYATIEESSINRFDFSDEFNKFFLATKYDL